MELRDRLEELMSEYGLKTQQQLADFAGVSKGLVGQWFNGLTGLGAKPLAAFDKKTKFSINWLAEGTGEKYKKDYVFQLETEDKIRLPRINVEASCGAGSINDQDTEVVDYVVVARKWARDNLGSNLSRIKVLTARGDSMNPTIEDGDVLFVDEGITYFSGEGIYIIWYTDGLKAKRVQSTVAGGLKLISDNSCYETETISGEELDNIRICGKVAGSWSFNRF